MHLSFGYGLLCACLFAVSCDTPRDFNVRSEVKGTEDIVSMEKDPITGLFTVICTNGTKETKVTVTSIKSGEVCLPEPKPDPAASQLNPMAFNAFNIWRDGNGAEILNYPEGYVDRAKLNYPDSVFYVSLPDFFTERGQSGEWDFTAVPTLGATVDSKNVLMYPVQNGKQLVLHFSGVSEKRMSQLNAVQYCKALSARLPTAREIFDFCVTGVEKSILDGKPNYSSYPDDARCGIHDLWSASVSSNDTCCRDSSSAWAFHESYGYVADEYVSRENLYYVRCIDSK